MRIANSIISFIILSHRQNKSTLYLEIDKQIHIIKGQTICKIITTLMKVVGTRQQNLQSVDVMIEYCIIEFIIIEFFNIGIYLIQRFEKFERFGKNDIRIKVTKVKKVTKATKVTRQLEFFAYHLFLITWELPNHCLSMVGWIHPIDFISSPMGD